MSETSAICLSIIGGCFVAGLLIAAAIKGLADRFENVRVNLNIPTIRLVAGDESNQRSGNG